MNWDLGLSYTRMHKNTQENKHKFKHKHKKSIVLNE